MEAKPTRFGGDLVIRVPAVIGTKHGFADG